MFAVNGTLVAPHCRNNVVFGVSVEVGEDMEMGQEDKEAYATQGAGFLTSGKSGQKF